MEDIKGKNVLITGASQGLGAVIAEFFAAKGARVFVNCAHGVEKAEGVAKTIKEAGGDAVVFQCDISNENELNAKLETLQKQYGGIDILINNARLDPYLRKAEMSDGEWFDKTLAVNLKGAYLPILAVIEGMKQRGYGRIVNVSSVWAYWPANRRMMAYSVSKAGMHAMTRGFAKEAAPYNVTVNTVAPGLILTENVSKRLSPEQFKAETATVPLGRGASSEEIAEVIFNTVVSGFITGETVNVNGGAFMPV